MHELSLSMLEPMLSLSTPILTRSAAAICPISTEDIYLSQQKQDGCRPPTGNCDVFC